MANYIPPHKRQLKDGVKALEGSSLNSRSLVHKFQQNLNLSGSYKSESCLSEKVMGKGKVASLGGRYAYAKSCHSRLCIIDSTEEEEHQYPGAIRLEHITSKSSLYKEPGSHGSIPYVLVSSHKKTGMNELNKNCSIENPLISVAEQILPNLLAFQNERVEGSSKEFEEGKISFVARFGKILFHTKPWFGVDKPRDRSEYEASLGQMKRVFNASVPKSFTESVLNAVVTEIGVDLEGEKEYYYVRVADKSCPDVSLSCKCTATGVGGLELRKIETNNVRHMMVDIACVEKDLDLRLMLSTRKIVTEPTEEEKHDLEKLIKSAVVDQHEKGGLRFPLGNESFEGRYRVVGTGHTTSTAYKNSSIRVKLNEADRYDFITSTAEVTNHVVLKMTGVSEKLKANILERDQLAEVLEVNMKIIWNHFLSLECCFT
ncbi:uncharacterized protein LOC113300608 [Papaver somniferum]|uniref:uncharacterized protein LOC113300608 n=1 Tax=Papaver somniferum TaxID=3469 RepID=UPI000E70412F|nr:uncharacterized protein LOC113300608 [Papaver somniferum]XP_026405597.1 uncharacterized protein LOC113300608 [Papaver somniferum]